MGYVEHGGSWRALWLLTAFAAGLPALDLVLPGPDVPGPTWGAVIGFPLGVVGVSTLLARRAWTVRVDHRGLTVGREQVGFADIDVDHLRAVDSGVDAGAPVLGGGWSVPRGRAGMPLRFADGRTVLVPTRDPVALRAAVLAARGTLDA